ncbi:hypothetical protein ACSNOI_23595, partial [Actinomadura kijaniata]|uniref:hypothetical protein n=1 Tax=Actinomadura kijaniata TaxID=46161 RepID=UPI003F1B95AA
MRRLTTALAVLLLAVGALVAPAHADETVTFGRVAASKPVKETGEAWLFAEAAAPGGVTAVTLRLRLRGRAEPYRTVELELAGGTAAQGTWRSPGPVRLERGRTFLDVEAVTSSGTRSARPEAAHVDHTPVALGAVAFSGNHDGPFQPTVQVETAAPIARVEVRFHRPGATVPAATADDFREYQRHDLGGYFLVDMTTVRPITLPAGEYHASVSVWNDAGDQYDAPPTKEPYRVRERAAFTELRAAPSETDVEAPGTEITGRLAAVADRAPLAGVEVDVSGTRAVTGPDGTFRASIVTRGGARHVVSYAGDARYGRAEADLPVTFRPQATELSAAFSPAPTTVGQTVKITGMLTRRTRAGNRTPLADRRIVARGVTTGAESTATTGKDGTYTITVVAGRDRQWSVETRHQDGDYADARRLLPASPLTLKYVPAFERLDFGPEPRYRSMTTTVAGTLMRRMEDGTTRPVPRPVVRLQHSTDGRTWKDVPGELHSTSEGWFEITVPVTAGGHLRFRYAGDAAHVAALSPARRVVAKYRTELLGAKRSLNKRKLTVSGRLERYVNGPKPAARGAKVTIYFRARGATKWKAVATTTTDSRGRFSRTVTASGD